MNSVNPFYSKIIENTKRTNSHLCIGLDPDPLKIPSKFEPTVKGTEEFLTEVIKNTSDLCIAYKPNISFFEALGIEGLRVLERLCKLIPSTVPIILDAKRGDIGNTAKKQASYLFDIFGADASTVNPLMGSDCVEPFLEYKDKFHFILALTSNPGAEDFEKLMLKSGKFLYEQVIDTCTKWNKTYGNVGCVIGATKSELASVRTRDKNLPFLVPGVGAQGGDYDSTSMQTKNKDNVVLINVSRGVLYVSKENDYLDKMRAVIIENYTNNH
ncbi:orotidine-5'-phosphate decarboxylase [bacterium]|jgi:orotidine-5'-phosphate decarboxylase|nr:orotidine-5'-phosphate decarboxylase [bacterium]